MDINFDNPDFDGELQKAGFERQEEGSTFFHNDGITIDLSKGMNIVNLRKIIMCAYKKGEKDRAKKIRDLLE